jgi:hypothetical protein
MAKEKFKYGDLSVDVEYVGDGSPPWDERGEPHHEYDVRVKGAGGNYKTKAWGSLHDYEKGDATAHRDMARMVLGELVSAASDPDEWISMMIGEAAGREALERGKAAERMIKIAEKFDQDALFAAGDAAREEEESGVN